MPDRFTALGTEPFWAAEIDGATLLYKTPEDQAGARVAVTRRLVGEAVELRGELAGAPLILTITAGRCSDGMSDRVYSYRVARQVGGDLQRGCATAEDLRRNAA